MNFTQQYGNVLVVGTREPKDAKRNGGGRSVVDREKVIKGLECCRFGCDHVSCPYNELEDCEGALHCDVLVLLKAQESVKPTINEYGEAYCMCGENVGIIPSSKNLPSIRSKYCSECGRRMKWG